MLPNNVAAASDISENGHIRIPDWYLIGGIVVVLIAGGAALVDQTITILRKVKADIASACREALATAEERASLRHQANEVERVKMICGLAHGSAEAVHEAKDDPECRTCRSPASGSRTGLTVGRLDYERKRYEEHRTEALDAAKAITDEFYRLHH
jgi:hypothetical protein